MDPSEVSVNLIRIFFDAMGHFEEKPFMSELFI